MWQEYTRDELQNTPAGMRVSAKSLPPGVNHGSIPLYFPPVVLHFTPLSH